MIILQNLNFLKFNQKIAENRVNKILITIPLTLETMQQLIIKYAGGPWAPGAGKKCNFLKIAKIRDIEKHSITSRNYAVNYYQTLEEVSWILRLEQFNK